METVWIEAIRTSGGGIALALVLVLYAAVTTVLKRSDGQIAASIRELEERLTARIDALGDRVGKLEACRDDAEHRAQRERDAAYLAVAVRKAVQEAMGRDQ